jgi:hypothetical protein
LDKKPLLLKPFGHYEMKRHQLQERRRRKKEEAKVAPRERERERERLVLQREEENTPFFFSLTSRLESYKA